MLLVKEINEGVPVAEDIMMLALKIIYTSFMVSESIYMEKGVWGAKTPRSQRHLEISNKMESFPSYGSRIFFSLFLRPYYF